MVRNKYLDVQRRDKGHKTWAFFEYRILGWSTYDASGKEPCRTWRNKIIAANKSFVQDFRPQMADEDLAGIR